MAVESAADRLAMLADFGVDVTPAAGPSFLAIVQSGYEAQDYFEDLRLSDRSRVLLCRTSDVAGLAKGDALDVDDEIEGTASWTVASKPRPDGTGFSHVLLAEA